MSESQSTYQRMLTSGARIHSALRRRGLRAMGRRAWVRIARCLGRDIADPYRDWIEDHAPSRSDLAVQRRWSRTAPGLPNFLLIIRPHGERRTYLSHTLRSLRRQTYPHWSTLILAEDPAPSSIALPLGGPAYDYVGIIAVGDTLSPEALYEFARAIVDRDMRPDVLYCDEDHLDSDG